MEPRVMTGAQGIQGVKGDTGAAQMVPMEPRVRPGLRESKE